MEVAPEARGTLLREYWATNRVAIWGICAASAVFILITELRERIWWTVVLLACLPVLGWLLAERPRVWLYSNGMAVRGPLRSGWVERADIVDLDVRYAGLLVRRRQGTTMVVWAAQQPRWKVLKNRQTKAERLASRIERWVAGDDDPA